MAWLFRARHLSEPRHEVLAGAAGMELRRSLEILGLVFIEEGSNIRRKMNQGRVPGREAASDGSSDLGDRGCSELSQLGKEREDAGNEARRSGIGGRCGGRKAADGIRPVVAGAGRSRPAPPGGGHAR